MDALSILALGVAQAGGGGGGGTSDYSDLSNKPQINNVTLSGNKSLSDLGIQGEIEGNSISPSQIEMTGLNSFVDITPDNGISVASGAPGMPNKGIFISPGMNTIDIMDEDRSQQGMMPMASLGVSQNSELTVNGSAVAMKSDIPTVNNARLTIRRNGVAVRSFTANDNVDRSADILVPEKTSDLTNDSGFITLSDVPKELPTISTGDAGKVLTVNSGETGVEWATGGGGGGSYTFTNGLTESSGTVSWDLNGNIKQGGYDYSSVGIGDINTINLGNNGYAIALGKGVWSNGSGSAAIGYGTSSNYIHAGNDAGSIAMGYSDQFEGLSSNGKGSIALGYCTKARSNGQIAVGKFNIADTSNTYAFIIGNGSAGIASNALTVDWSGNLVCNNIPAPPSSDGTYTLQCSISSGVATYTWVAQV